MPAETVQAPPLEPDRAEQLASALASADDARLRDALVLPDDQPLDAALAPGLAALQLRMDVATFRGTGADSAEVSATAGSGEQWTAFLLHTGGTWRIVATEQVPA